MEEKIYERQVAKQSISRRVVDEKQIARHYSHAELKELYELHPDRPYSNNPAIPRKVGSYLLTRYDMVTHYQNDNHKLL